MFYQDAIEKKEKNISFWGLPSCLKWYGGAIYIEKAASLKPGWVNCFYNKEQAMKAWAIMDKVMDNHFTWPKGNGNWVEKNAAVLRQIYDKVDEVKP